MNTKLIHVTWAMLLGLVVVLVMGGCNTVKGVGKDVERTGEKIQGEP